MITQIVCFVVAIILAVVAVSLMLKGWRVLGTVCLIILAGALIFAGFTHKVNEEVKQCSKVYATIEKIDKQGIDKYKTETLKTIKDLYNKYNSENDTYNGDLNYHYNKMKAELDAESKKQDDQKDNAKIELIQKVMDYTKVRAQNIENFDYNKSIVESYPKYVQDRCKKN